MLEQLNNPLGTGERFTVKNLAFGLGYGLMVTDRVTVGVAGKLYY